MVKSETITPTTGRSGFVAQPHTESLSSEKYKG